MCVYVNSQENYLNYVAIFVFVNHTNLECKYGKRNYLSYKKTLYQVMTKNTNDFEKKLHVNAKYTYTCFRREDFADYHSHLKKSYIILKQSILDFILVD